MARTLFGFGVKESRPFESEVAKGPTPSNKLEAERL